MTRHTLSGFTGQLLVADYLHHIASLGPDQEQGVAELHKSLHTILQSFPRIGRFRGGLEGGEGLNVMDNLANLLFYYGDEEALGAPVLEQMWGFTLACRDNLGCRAGVNSYIDCRPGTHLLGGSAGCLGGALAVWRFRDPQLLWLMKKLGAGAGGYLHVRFPPQFLSPDPNLEPTYPQTLVGVQVIPLDGYLREFGAT